MTHNIYVRTHTHTHTHTHSLTHSLVHTLAFTRAYIHTHAENSTDTHSCTPRHAVSQSFSQGHAFTQTQIKKFHINTPSFTCIHKGTHSHGRRKISHTTEQHGHIRAASITRHMPPMLHTRTAHRNDTQSENLQCSAEQRLSLHRWRFGVPCESVPRLPCCRVSE